MERLRKFLCLSNAERWILIKVALLLAVIAVSKRLLPFRTVRRLLARAADRPVGRQHADRLSAQRVVWAVEAASRHIPRTKSCLTQALAAQLMLTRRGYPALVHLGVTRGEQGQFQAHAWVEMEGKAVIGRSGLERFTPLTLLKGVGP